MRKLIVVESPTKARTLKKYLPKQFDILASVGHIKNLPKSKIGVDIEQGSFEPEYKLIPGKRKVVNEILEKAKDADTIYLAPDPDREGEAIAAHLCEEIQKKVKGKKIFRILMHEITKKGMAAALDNPHDIDYKRYESQQARRVLDRIVGYLISPLLWEKVKMGTSAGRVQSVALRLASEREKEIKAFQSKDYYKLPAQFQVSLNTESPESLDAELTQCNGEKFTPKDSELSLETLKQKADVLRKAPWHIHETSSKNRTRSAPKPFITSTLQMDASSKVRYSPKKTMMLAQQLYEGVELGEHGTQGLITYMRTDSTRVSQDAKDAAKSFILDTWGKDYLGSSAAPKGPAKKSSKVQDAHEAIRPVDIAFTPDKVKPFLAKDQLALYTLIWKRFIASQMSQAKFLIWQVQFSTADKKDIFTHSQQSVVFDGFLILWQDDETDSILSAEFYKQLTAKTPVQLNSLEITEHKTEPPPRYNEASLIKELEKRGIGRPSTYASIISTIIDRKYIDKVKAKLIPTSLGTAISDLLAEHFTQIMSYDFTANMETKLDMIEEGELGRKELLTEFYTDFQIVLEKAKKEMKNLKAQEIPTDLTCEQCDAHFNIRWGKSGEFLSCSSYPKCRNAKNFEKDENGKIHIIEPKAFGKPCPTCSKRLLERFGRYGRYLACEDYPECKTTLPFPIGVDCPKCSKGDVVERRSKQGRFFYGCNQYPDCDFASWQKPNAKPCPECANPYMVEKETKKLGYHLACPSCKHTIPITDEVNGETSS